MDSLKSADMPAVLERTNLKANRENFLLPIYEAISNAIYSTQDKWGLDVASLGSISLEITTASFSAKVIDNGEGLTPVNYDNFKTPFTGARLRRGGKGFGRFIAFKVFENITYHSSYEDTGGKQYRSFDFDIYSENEIKEATVSLTTLGESGCVVYYQNPKDIFQAVFEQMAEEEIIERIVRYFLPFFISGQMPKFTIKIDGASFDTRDHFAEFFKPEINIVQGIEIDGATHKFSIDIAKVKKGKLFSEHVLLLFADGRIIGSGRSIEGKIGSTSFVDENGEKFVYVATAMSEFLDKSANTARTAIEASEQDIDSIAKMIASEILKLEDSFVRKHRGEQSADVKGAILKNPLLRSALNDKTISEYVSGQPMNWKTENFVSDLALKRYRGQNTWEKTLETGFSSVENLASMRESLLANIDQENKHALASYIAHRKSVLELAERILGFQDDGGMSKEDIIHDLIHPQYEDSETTKFYQHNLWLIDDKLAFFSYCSSDRTIHGGRRKKGDKIADLVFFEDCSVYEDGDNSSLVLVEFKKPGRDNYKYGDVSKDPIEQVKATAIQIRDEGKLITKSGRTVSVPDGVRIYAYVVADMEPTLKRVCKNHDMNVTWDNKGFYTYHRTNDIFIESIGYDKMLSDAAKRNAAFFEILLGDIQ